MDHPLICRSTVLNAAAASSAAVGEASSFVVSATASTDAATSTGRLSTTPCVLLYPSSLSPSHSAAATLLGLPIVDSAGVDAQEMVKASPTTSPTRAPQWYHLLSLAQAPPLGVLRARLPLLRVPPRLPRAKAPTASEFFLRPPTMLVRSRHTWLECPHM